MQQQLLFIFVSSFAIILLLMFLLIEMSAVRHKKELKSRDDELSEFAHDIKTPINSIKGFAEGIFDGTVKEQDREKYLDIIISECDRLCKMTDDFVLSGKLGTAHIEKRDVKIYDLIGDVLLSFEKEITDKNITVTGVERIENSDEKNACVLGDKQLLHRAFYNVFANAVKYTSDGGGISLTINDKGKYICVSVSNTAGVKGDVKRIFDKNYRGESDENGTGLGLYIVKSIVEQHKGEVYAESENDKTCITVTLPASK